MVRFVREMECYCYRSVGMAGSFGVCVWDWIVSVWKRESGQCWRKRFWRGSWKLILCNLFSMSRMAQRQDSGTAANICANIRFFWGFFFRMYARPVLIKLWQSAQKMRDWRKASMTCVVSAFECLCVCVCVFEIKGELNNERKGQRDILRNQTV